MIIQKWRGQGGLWLKIASSGLTPFARPPDPIGSTDPIARPDAKCLSDEHYWIGEVDFFVLHVNVG